MLFCRYGPEGFHAAGESLAAMRVLHSDPYTTPVSGWRFGHETDVAREALRAPIEPGKIVGIGRNYAEHARELDHPVPAEPVLFLKSPGAVIGHLAPVVLPPESERVEHEGEIAVVVGRRLSRASAADAARAVLGVTAACDVTARDLQRRDPTFARAKSFDTFCPLGPAVLVAPDLDDLAVVTRVNGEERQRGHVSQMLWGIVELLVYASRMMTLEPGDVVLTGTPAGVGPLADGDRLEVEVPGVGVLVNPVEAWRRG
ncbi:MAG: fumarylacetoacetate hydrolase family protein [Thermoanaerobaculia bacterium]|nr:MAG: fumarylacetoacetate hydrolase family protein [Thermoanaerobaculia bacterium]